MRTGTLRMAALSALGVLLLSGCVGADPLPTLPPTPSSTPLFASEEEALAAAEDAYAAYLEMSDLIASEGGAEPERIAPFVSSARLADELAGFQSYRDLEIRTTGATSFVTKDLQRYDEDSDGVEVVIYACVDATAVRVLNKSGEDVTPDDRVAQGLREVTFVSGSESDQLHLETDTQWQSGPC